MIGVKHALAPRKMKARSLTSMRRAAFLSFMLAILLVWSTGHSFASLPNTSRPVLQLERTIRTTPFAGSNLSARDAEGSASVPVDGSLWLADDNKKSIYEIDPVSGRLKRVINGSAFEVATQFGGGSAAGSNRAEDFEAIAYDAANDFLYVFSGSCCTSSVLPTAYRLVRDGTGNFQVESYQPLSSGSDFPGAAWNPADGRLWVGKGSDLRPYTYNTNTIGPVTRVSGLGGIQGLTFTDDGADMLAVTGQERLVRVDWGGKRIVDGWNLDLTASGVADSRGVDLIADQLYVVDGYDNRPSDDPLQYAVFVFNVLGPPTAAPVASFTASPGSDADSLTVTFTDTSTGEPTVWAWDFGDGSISVQRHPIHTYSSPGTYTATLTASNSAGQSTATSQITVTSPPPPPNLVGNPDFETDTTGWGTSGSGKGVSLSRIVPGREDSIGAARLTNEASSKRKCVLNDQPNWVSATSEGSYTAGMWVRGEKAGAVLKLQLRELDGTGNQISARTSNHTLTTDWRKVTVVYTPRSPGTSSLDFQAFLPQAEGFPGTCFYADDASITGG